MPKHAKICQNLPKMPKHAQICQNLPKMPKHAKICQNMPKMPKFAKTCQNLVSPFLLMMGHLNQESMDRKAIYISRLLCSAAPPLAGLLQPGYHSKALPCVILKSKLKIKYGDKKFFLFGFCLVCPFPQRLATARNTSREISFRYFL